MRLLGLFALAILFPMFVHAATLVNINTAGAALLVKSLAGTGIGQAKATAIVEYRNVHGLFARIEDIQKVSGIGNGVTYANIAPYITIGDTSVSDTSDTVSDNTASSTVSSSSEENTETYTPPPSALTVDAGSANQDTNMNVPLYLSARVTTKGGAVDPSAQIVWGFGDGSSATASAVKKTYYYAGTYLVAVTATDGLATGRDEIIVTVRPAQVRVLVISDAGIMISNDASERLDISEWVLFSDKKSFRIPSDTVILPKSNTILPVVVTHLVSTTEVTLAYPDGSIAARYVPQASPMATVAQPSISSTSSNEVKKVEPIISQKTSVQKNENAVSAPTAATELAAVGATVPASLPKKSSPVGNLLKSPWTLGFIGTVILAGGAFILL
jgi:competence protein ComEA